MILREEKDPAIRGYAGNIQASGNSLLSIVSDVLDISKIESGKLEIIPVDYEVNSLISDCCNMAAGRAKAKELELLVECADNVPMKLCGDETHIRQIIMNLLTNAVKYTEKGTVKLIYRRWVCAESGCQRYRNRHCRGESAAAIHTVPAVRPPAQPEYRGHRAGSVDSQAALRPYERNNYREKRPGKRQHVHGRASPEGS